MMQMPIFYAHLQDQYPTAKKLCQCTYILLRASIWFVPGFNFYQKVIFHVLVLPKREDPVTYWKLGNADNNIIWFVGVSWLAWISIIFILLLIFILGSTSPCCLLHTHLDCKFFGAG